MKPWTLRFLDLADRCQALQFGRFTLKSGRSSPYFFNAGAFDSGSLLAGLADCYADAIAESGVQFDVLFGPAYKGIALAAVTAAALARTHAIDAGFGYDRKEAKDHGEGGVLVGAPLTGRRVLLIDDVMSAGTAFGLARERIEAAGGRLVGAVIALDRQERGRSERSAVDELRARGLTVITIARLEDLLEWLNSRSGEHPALSDMLAYRSQFGA